MEVDQQHIITNHDAENDPFLLFIDYAISVLLSPISMSTDNEEVDEEDVIDDQDLNRPAWSWVTGRVIKTCKAYSSGVTPAILLSELSQVLFLQKY